MSDFIFRVGNIFRFHNSNSKPSKAGGGEKASLNQLRPEEDVVAISSQGKRLEVFRNISSQVVERLTTSGPKQETTSSLLGEMEQDSKKGELET